MKTPEQKVADILPLEVDPVLARRVLREVPFWFHTFALNYSEGIYTPGVAVDHRYRPPSLPASFASPRVLDVGTFDGFSPSSLRRAGQSVWWPSTASSTSTGYERAGASNLRAARASGRSHSCLGRAWAIVARPPRTKARPCFLPPRTDQRSWATVGRRS